MVIELLEQILPHVKNSIYPVRKQLQDWKMCEASSSGKFATRLNDSLWTPITLPAQWGHTGKTFIFRNSITITPEFAGKTVALLLDFEDAILFINGKPFQAISKEHHEVVITEKARLNEQYTIQIEAYSGTKLEPNNFNFAELVVLDPVARRLASGLTALQELEKVLEHGSDELKDLRELIRRTLIYLKYFKPGSEEYPNAIRRAYNFLINAITDEFKTNLPGLIYFIAYSRINSLINAKLETGELNKRNCIKVTTTCLRLLEEFPELKISYNQTLFYDLIKKDCPELYKDIKKQILNGKWEPLCTTWTETDFNIPNGESLVRQILFTKKFLKQEFGKDSNIMWVPESYGFCASLPQILAKSGISYFATTTLLINDTTKFPYNSFWWEGIDGTRILTHIPPVACEARINPKQILRIHESIPEELRAYPVIQPFGGNEIKLAPTKQDIEYLSVLKTTVGLPPSQLSSFHDFFIHLQTNYQDLPIWNDELYLEAHRGIYTTHGQIKKGNRDCEKLLYITELLSTLGMIFGKNSKLRRYPKKELELAWKKLLFNQNYNLIGGTFPKEIYDKTLSAFSEIKKLCHTEISRSIKSISSSAKKSKNEFHFAIFNPLGWTRSDYVEIFIKSKEKKISVWEFDTEGKTGKRKTQKRSSKQEKESPAKLIEHQLIERTQDGQKILCFIQDVPPFGFKNLVVRIGEVQQEFHKPWKSSAQALETPFYKIRFDRKGEISTIYSKEIQKDIIQKGKRGNQLQTFHESTKEWEAWDLLSDYRKNQIDILHFRHAKIIEAGPLRATIHLAFRTNNGSVISQMIHFYHQIPRIDFHTEITWREKRTLLKTAFAFNLHSTEAAYEIPMGTITRSTKPRSEQEKAKYEVPAQQWADISDTTFGVSLINDCKYAYDAHESVLRLTLLRSPHYPDKNEPVYPDQYLTDQGEHLINYALYPHRGDWKTANTSQCAKEFNYPLMVFPNIYAKKIPAIITVSKPNIVIDSIKKAEDTNDIIVRLHEASGIDTKAMLTIGIKIANIFECDLLENNQREVNISNSKINLKFKPYEIKTIKLILKK